MISSIPTDGRRDARSKIRRAGRGVIAALFAALLLAAPAVLAQGFDQESPFEFDAEAFRLRGEPGRAEVRLHIDVPPGHYLYRHMLDADFAGAARFHVDEVRFPQGKVKFDPFMEEDTEIFDHSITVTGLLTLLPGEEFPETIPAWITFQGCTSEYCYFPEEKDLDLPWEWKDETEATVSTEAPSGGDETAQASPATGPALFNVADRIASKGLFLTYLGVFIAGILLSFTPCVFPMVPITLSIIGARGETNPMKGFSLSLVYVLGMALTYAVLGLVAASTGAIFGSIMQSTAFVLVVISIFVVLALGMFGMFELQVPSSMAVKLQGVGGGGGYVGIFLMGIMAGLIASPCVGPVLVGLLVYIAQTGNALLGFTLLFTLALGIGVLFLVIGTFSGMIGRLPGAGTWMDQVKQVFGFLLLLVAVYFGAPLIPEKLVLLLYGLILVFFASFFGLFEPLAPGAGPLRRIGKGIVLLIGVTGVLLFIGTLVVPMLPLPMVAGGPASHEAAPAWMSDHAAGLERAASEGKPVIIDFTADWCAACKELEHYTYSDGAVIAESERFVMVMIDATRSTEPVKALLAEYDVKGLPTVAFIDSKGERRHELTVTGFIQAEPFLEIMRAVR